jgi:tripartite-type tricarboxylate transporter receptor subunit TctC
MNYTQSVVLFARASALSLIVGTTAVNAAQQRPAEADYPSRPIRIIVTVPAGGSVDSVTRAMAQKLSEDARVPVVVDNRVGGTGTIAMNTTAQAAPDGYTVLSASNSMVVTGVLKKVPYDIRKAFEPVVQMTSSAYVITVPPSLPVASLKELIAYAKAKPDALSYGTPGVGSIIHLSTELFNHRAGGLRMVHVPYKGNSIAIVDLIAGRIQLLFAAAGVAPHLKSGKLKALAVTGRRRMQAFPDLPTLAEAGLAGLVLDNVYGLYAPAGVAPQIVTALNRRVSAAMNTPEVKERVAVDGLESTPPHAPADFKASFRAQFDQWDQFMRTSSVKLD